MTEAGVTYKIYLISLSEFKRRFSGYAVDGLDVIPQYSHKKIKGELAREIIEDITDEQETIAVSLIDSAPIQKIVNIILKNAISKNASDIHIENVGDYVRARNRMDGVLNSWITFPIHMHAPIVARIKILCGLRLDEKRKPQDGRFSVRYESHKIDFRVSTFLDIMERKW